ncbi:hypothetical protein VTK56DRAFT_6939 [Thermocarpiscus australiensis]
MNPDWGYREEIQHPEEQARAEYLRELYSNHPQSYSQLRWPDGTWTYSDPSASATVSYQAAEAGPNQTGYPTVYDDPSGSAAISYQTATYTYPYESADAGPSQTSYPSASTYDATTASGFQQSAYPADGEPSFSDDQIAQALQQWAQDQNPE